MGECISYPRLPNMAPVKQAAQLYGLSPYYIRRLCPGGADPRSSQRPPGVPLMN